MSYRQHTQKKVQLPVQKIVQIECEKTGTIYYENTHTKSRAWTKSALEDKK